MGVRILAEHYRVLRKIEWDLPKGVCALVGPNGSGKTTLLDVLDVLRDIFTNGVWAGLGQHGAVESMRNLHAERTSHIKLGARMDSVDWQLDFVIDDATDVRAYNEMILDGGATVAQKKPGDKVVGNEQLFRVFAYDKYATGPNKSRLLPPISHLANYRLYRPYDLNLIRGPGSVVSTAPVLLPQGHNIFSVLRNWRDRRATKDRYDFVIEGLKEAFPDIFEDLELESTERTVTGRVFIPHQSESLLVYYAPSGLLTGLLHLAAVASTDQGGIVAIDEPENGLHPYAVKRILGAMREWADEQDLTVLLATHSPMLIDQFKDEPEHLFVMEPGRDVLPVRVDEVRNREWLAQFSLGDLYKHGDFGAPLEEAAAHA